MFGFIYCQRRRIFITTFVLMGETIRQMVDAGEFVSVTFASPSINALLTGLTFALTALIVAAIYAFVIILVPLLRIVGDAMVLFCVFGWGFAFLGHATLGDAHAFLEWSWMVCLGVWIFIWSPMADRLPVRFTLRGSNQFRSKRSAKELWPFLCPQPETLNQFWDPLLSGIRRDEKELNLYHAKYVRGGSNFELQKHYFTKNDAPVSYRYVFEGDAPPNALVVPQGELSVSVEEDADNGSCLITVAATRRQQTLQQKMLTWLDDEIRDLMCCMRARDRGKKDWSLRGRSFRDTVKAGKPRMKSAA